MLLWQWWRTMSEARKLNGSSDVLQGPPDMILASGSLYEEKIKMLLRNAYPIAHKYTLTMLSWMSLTVAEFTDKVPCILDWGQCVDVATKMEL